MKEKSLTDMVPESIRENAKAVIYVHTSLKSENVFIVAGAHFLPEDAEMSINKEQVIDKISLNFYDEVGDKWAYRNTFIVEAGVDISASNFSIVVRHNKTANEVVLVLAIADTSQQNTSLISISENRQNKNWDVTGTFRYNVPMQAVYASINDPNIAQVDMTPEIMISEKGDTMVYTDFFRNDRVYQKYNNNWHMTNIYNGNVQKMYNKH